MTDGKIPQANALEAALRGVCARLEAEPDAVDALFEKAQLLARLGRDDDAKSAFLAVLQREPAHFGALTDLAGLALATGYRSAALTAYREAVAHHPDNAHGLVNLANLLLEDDDLPAARQLYEAALRIDPDLVYAHQGLAHALTKLGEYALAAPHWEKGYARHSVVTRPYRGTGEPLRVLLPVSARGGNIPTNLLLDDRIFAVTALYAEYHDATHPLPAHDIVFNAVGDEDLCAAALDDVAKIVARTVAPIINPPERIRNTGRAGNSTRLSTLPDVVVPRVATIAKSSFRDGTVLELLARNGLQFPLLIRAPGFHTGQHFVRVEDASALRDATEPLPGDALFAIEYLDSRGAEGTARKYRVMFIDGRLYPLHLAMSRSWKVHYFTSAMADDAGFRREEEYFLRDMRGALGARAMRGLEQVRDALGLDYGGIDFGLSEDGRVLLFEANATMAIVPPPPDAVWDYRRPSVAAAIEAVRQMLFARR